MAETIGSLADKISIMELKIYHMKEQIERKDADTEHKEESAHKMKILQMQRNDLEIEIKELFEKYASGQARPKIYRQFKMYNDPKYTIKKAGDRVKGSG
ncbi:MAG: DUF4254 domain-containing protein [Elusimicrobiales bacterium]|nr:DUF4254 domain-containing protein [Elusimicrobiales bacterium]